MLYTTVPGPSSGRLGPFVGDVFQEIRPEEKRSECVCVCVRGRGISSPRCDSRFVRTRDEGFHLKNLGTLNIDGLLQCTSDR